MATPETASTETLFQQWRKGDAASGQAMAQRFTDWYFAIAASRLGEQDGDAAFREACNAFSRGVGKVTDARRLLGWAHSISKKRIETAVPTGRVSNGDLPNSFTRKHPPKEILVRAREHLPTEMHLLEHAYRGDEVADPIAVLGARYRLKAWLASQFDLPLRVTPARPDPDRAPISFYEAGRLHGEDEDTHFELYMLHDMEVCQDVAEFAHFAIALRGGLPGEPPAPRAERAPAPPPPPGAAPQAPAHTPGPMAPAPTAHAPAKRGQAELFGQPAWLVYLVAAIVAVLAFAFVLAVVFVGMSGG